MALLECNDGGRDPMKRLTVLGLNHRTTPLEVREKLAFSAEQTRAALAALRERYAECEAVLLSTCNRVELYLARPTHAHPRQAEAAQFLADMRGLRPDDFENHLQERSERDAVSHLFSVASSLDSMVVGETQILGQVRQAYDAAQQAGTAGATLHPLFQRALAVGKQVMSQTGLADGRTSIASVAVEYARRIFDVFSDKTVLSIGAGKMAWLVLTNLAALKPGKLWVCNRDPQKGQHLAEKFGGEQVGFGELAEHLSAADIVVSSTGSSQPIITRANFESAMRRRRNKPVFIIDIAVPRDVAPAVGELPNVYLYNLDDLQKAVAETQTQRGSAVEAAREIVHRQVLDFTAWQRARELGPMIDQLYRQSHALAQDELARTLGKLSNISSTEKEHLEDLTRRIVNKLLHDPVQMLRESDGMHGSINQYLHAMEKLFKLDGSAGAAASETEDAEQ